MSEIELVFRSNMDEHINKIKEKYPDIKFYSYSKLGNFNQCKKGYYYTYIDKKVQKPSVYTELGTAAHTTLEDLYDGKVDKLDKALFDNEFKKCELFGIDFPKSKYDIKGGYYKDISAFYNIYNHIEAKEGDKFISELGFILILNEKSALMGYIDLLILHNDNSCEIVDFKTSANFDKKKVVEAARQLILYSLAMEQLYGLKVNTVSWEMLKYVSVQVGNYKRKEGIRGREWVEKCSTQIKALMKKKNYDPGLIDMYVALAINNNSIDGLPDDIKSEIKVNTYRRFFDITEEAKKEFYEYTLSSIENINKMLNKREEEWICEVYNFFCINLCGFYPKHCNPILNLSNKI